jgi:hypothetical protein
MAGRLFGRSRQTDTPSPAPSLPGLANEPRPIDVTLFTRDGIGDIQVLAGSGRITDVLNGAEPVRVRAKPDAEEPGEGPWIDLDIEQRDEILALAPPPMGTNPLLRLHRPSQEVSVRIGPYLVTGEAHVPAGSEATGFLMRHRPHFIPLTRAKVSQADEQDVSVPVAIVNLWVAESLTNASLDMPAATETNATETNADELMAPEPRAHESVPPEVESPPPTD